MFGSPLAVLSPSSFHDDDDDDKVSSTYIRRESWLSWLIDRQDLLLLLTEWENPFIESNLDEDDIE